MSNAADNGVSSKRTRPIPHDFERTIYDVTLLGMLWSMVDFEREECEIESSSHRKR